MLPERTMRPLRSCAKIAAGNAEALPAAGARRGARQMQAGRGQEGALPYSLSFELCRYVHPCSIHPEEGHRAEIEQGYVN